MVEPIIHCSHVSKIFKEKKESKAALSDISFFLPANAIIGLLGPDGSGKTTLLRLFAGLYRPTCGTIQVLGMDSVKNSEHLQSTLGYMPQKFGLYENLSVEENMVLYAELHGLPKCEQEKRFTELLNLTSLTQFRQRMAGKLSGGMKQKLALACSLVSNPPLLLLDEPTVGVDVLSRRELWKILRKLVNEGNTTVLASTSYIDEVSYCDRVLILHQGKLISNSTPEELRQKAAPFIENPSFGNGFQILLSGKIHPRLSRKNPVKEDSPTIIHAENIVKKFGDFTAVNRINFDVRRGEIFGLLGANGAGKTTTFRILCGLTTANEGSIKIAGSDLHSRAAETRRKIGFVAQKFSLYTDLSVKNNLEFFGGAYGLAGKKLINRIEWALNAFSLRSYQNCITAKLPLGYKQRLSMACALLHEPEILFLDEATSGADPTARIEFWERILDLADSGVTVIITTHYLDEAEYCDRMIIMQDGIAAASGSISEILKQGNTIKLEEAFVNIICNFKRKQGEL